MPSQTTPALLLPGREQAGRASGRFPRLENSGRPFVLRAALTARVTAVPIAAGRGAGAGPSSLTQGSLQLPVRLRLQGAGSAPKAGRPFGRSPARRRMLRCASCRRAVLWHPRHSQALLGQWRCSWGCGLRPSPCSPLLGTLSVCRRRWHGSPPSRGLRAGLPKIVVSQRHHDWPFGPALSRTVAQTADQVRGFAA